MANAYENGNENEKNEVGYMGGGGKRALLSHILYLPRQKYVKFEIWPLL